MNVSNILVLYECELIAIGLDVNRNVGWRGWPGLWRNIWGQFVTAIAASMRAAAKSAHRFMPAGVTGSWNSPTAIVLTSATQARDFEDAPGHGQTGRMI